MMANLYDSNSRKRETVIRIPRFEIGEHFTVYTIEFALGPFKWSVNRRFSEFANLHDELYNRHKLRSVDLPAKKIFGNQSYSFVQRRQKELEEYLCRLFQIYTRPPPPLSRFSLWDKYEVHGITATMSAYVLGMGVNPSGTTSNGVPALPPSSSPSTPPNPNSVANQEWRRRLPFEFSVLQIHAINARIDSPAPTNDLDHMKYDVGHIMNFVTHLPAVRVWGSTGQFGTSNIIMNQLKYDLSVFKELETLELVRVDLANMRGVEQLKKTLSKIVVHSTLQTLKEFLLQDLMDFNIGEDSAMVQCWSRVKEADFADNSLRTIDEAIKLLPNVQGLNLSGNQIPSITNLEHLSELQRLNLSRNGITDLINLNAKLGNIKELILVENRLTSLLGLSRVYSLQSLDVSRNQISEIVEVCHIGRLPCLENLRLTDNPVTLIPDYRTKVFEQFGDRSPEVRLDGQRGTQKELDTAAVLQAIQRAKQHRTSSPDIRLASSVPSVRPRSLHSPASRTPASTASPNSGTSPDRPNMAAMRSRGGKQWLVEFNQMLDSRERERREEAESVGEVQTAVRVPLTQEEEDKEEVAEDSEVAAITDWSEAAVPTAANDRLEGRLEQALARLLHASGPPSLSAFASALTLMGGEEVGSGGAVAVTEDGRVILLSHHSDSGAARPRIDSAYDDTTQFAILLHWEAPNVAQIVRGYRGQYLRLEERFASGSDGVVVLLTLCASLTDRICDSIAAASGLSVVNLDRVRARQLEDFLRRAEDDSEAELVFYALAMFQSGLLRQLLSVLVSRRRLYLLDEQLASLPAPVCQQQQQMPTPSFQSLGVYSQHHLELEPQQGVDEAVVDVAPEDDFFRFAVRVRLSPEARGSLQELGFGFQTSEQRAEFLGSLSNLLPSSAPRSPAREAVPEPVVAGQLAFERWDALSAAVKHRVASATEAGSLQRLLDMQGEQLAAFFAGRVRADDKEELVAVLWTYWLHYRSRKQEALACVFLTQRCVHVVFGEEEEEETLAFKSLTRRTEESGSAVRVFCFALSSLRTVYVGPFNHYVRLCGDRRDSDLTLVTRDFRLTENLLSYLRAVFRGETSRGRMEVEEDEVYRSSVCPTSVERLASTGDPVEIRYPNDEVLSEMMYVVEEAVGNSKGEGGGALSASPHGAMLDSLTLLYYLLLEHLSIDFMEYVTCSSADHLMAVLILTDDYLVVLHQNISQYPIPEYECGPPEVPQFSVLDVRRLKCLTHLTLNSCDRRLLVLSFAPNPLHQAPPTPSTLPISHSADELGAAVPSSPGLMMPESASMNDFSSSVPNTAVPGTIYRPTSNLSPVGDPVHISAFIQNPKDVDKLVKLIKAAWKEYFPGQDLPVHRS